MLRRHYIQIAILIASVLTLPLYGDYLRSGVQWFMVQKPAGCFSTIRTVINDKWMLLMKIIVIILLLVSTSAFAGKAKHKCPRYQPKFYVSIHR